MQIIFFIKIHLFQLNDNFFNCAIIQEKQFSKFMSA